MSRGHSSPNTAGDVNLQSSGAPLVVTLAKMKTLHPATKNGGEKISHEGHRVLYFILILDECLSVWDEPGLLYFV